MIRFSSLVIGSTFVFEGQEYIKTNHQRGYFWKDGAKSFRYFKKNQPVEAKTQVFA